MSLETQDQLSVNVANFMDTYELNVTPKGVQIAAAIVHVPLMARADGRGPNAPILDGTQHIELNKFVKDSRFHVAALAVLAVARSGEAAVSLVPFAGAHTLQTKGGKKIEHPVSTFGRPVSATSDFGIPMEHRDWTEQFSGLLARFNSVGEELFGQTPKGLTLIGGQQNNRTDAERLARPALVFGFNRGLQVPDPRNVDASLALQGIEESIRSS